MSFASPVALLALAVIPAAIAVYLLMRRRRTRYAIRFPAVSTLREAGAAAPSWERHVPAGLALAAIALLAIALAHPRVTHRVPIGEASMMLVIDHSGSMAADDVQPTRLTAAVNAANVFIDQLPSSVRVGAVTFSSGVDAAQAPTTSHGQARAIVEGEAANGGTDTGNALQVALQLLHGTQRGHPPSAVVLLSDGAANAGPSPVAVARVAAQEHIPIYTVALGTPSGVLNNPDPLAPPVPVPPDPTLMKQIAQVSGAHAFNAKSADQLSSIYKSLGSKLGSVTRKQEITVVFAIAGLVALLGAVAASMRLWGRLP